MLLKGHQEQKNEIKNHALCFPVSDSVIEHYRILSRSRRWILPNNGTRSALISRTCFSESASNLRRSIRGNPRTPSTHPRRNAGTCIARSEKNPIVARYASTRVVAIIGGNDRYATQIPFRV